MVCPSSVLAHLIKLIVTVVCMKIVGDSDHAKGRSWPLHAFQILLAHSILGILRFGLPFTVSANTAGKYLRKFYDWYTRIIDVLPLALFTTGILNGYGVNEKIRLIILSLGVVPILYQLSTKWKERQIRKYRVLINVTATIQLFMIMLVGLRNSNYNVISLVISYIFERFFIDEFCYYYDIPNTDLTQYSLCFIETFVVLTLNEF